MAFDVLIVGSGHAGAHCAISLRQQGFEGSIGLAGEERALPYERPPLSKDYLAGLKDADSIAIRPESFWAENDIELLPGRTIVAVDAASHSVRASSGESIAYRKLVWAAGGNPRKIDCPGNNLGGIHTIRTLADVDALRSELTASKNIVIIGGGYIGLEAAAVLRGLGKSVTVLEALPRVLARVAGEELSRFYEAEHRRQGVDLRTSIAVECIEGSEQVEGIRLADGTIVPVDILIVGIGVIPAVQPLLSEGANGGNGVSVDEYCRTTLEDIYAIGDCALHHNQFAGGQQIRIESVQNATDMAMTVAKHLTGQDAPNRSLAWFWSNQYDLKLQTIGLSTEHDAAIVRGDPTTRSFSIVYFRDHKVIALDCVNRVKDFVQGRTLVQGQMEVDPVRLSDAEIPLKSLIEDI